MSITRGLEAVEPSAAPLPPANDVTPRAASRNTTRPTGPDHNHVTKRSNAVTRDEFMMISASVSPIATAALMIRKTPTKLTL